jgi:hypothetical protein
MGCSFLRGRKVLYFPHSVRDQFLSLLDLFSDLRTLRRVLSVFRAGIIFFFSTLIHNFAQTFSANSIDAASGQVYLAHRLNRKRNDFTVRFRLRDILTVVAILNGTGKFKDFPIQQGSCKSLTAIAAPNWIE